MSRKDYIAIAKCIRVSLPQRTAVGYAMEKPDFYSKFAIANDIAIELAKLMSQDNERFDADRFLVACGVKS